MLRRCCLCGLSISAMGEGPRFLLVDGLVPFMLFWVCSLWAVVLAEVLVGEAGLDVDRRLSTAELKCPRFSDDEDSNSGGNSAAEWEARLLGAVARPGAHDAALFTEMEPLYDTFCDTLAVNLTNLLDRTAIAEGIQLSCVYPPRTRRRQEDTGRPM